MKLYQEIKNSFPIIKEMFTKENLLEFKNSKISDLYLYHFGLGTWVRNNLLYPGEIVLYDLFLENGIENSDDMSSIIINLFHSFINIG